jgi:peptide chain release factor 1
MYEDIKKKFTEASESLQKEEITSNPKMVAEVSKIYSDLKEIVDLIFELEKIQKNIKENLEIIALKEDEDLVKMAEEELASLSQQEKVLKNEIDEYVNPADPNNKKNIIMEIRAGTGGDESALFSAELFRMYSKYAEKNGWKVSILHSSRIGIGGFKEIILEIKGKDAFKFFKYEGGTHRVQRTPETEKMGRVHTSTVTVVVLPEAEEVDLEIKNEDLRIDTYAASGPGGQCVNTTNSAVRITHVPTNTVVQCQDQKSQHQNKEKALQILRSRLLSKIEDEKLSQESADRKKQVGSGDRSEKIRTYNFPQDRITDHRIKKSWSQINNILEGNLEDIIQSLQDYKE